jgi:hypothetical protein
MATTYLNKTLSGSPTNNLKWTWSAWVKKTKNGIIQPLFYADDGSSANFTKIQFHDTDSVLAQNYVGSSTYGYKITTGVYRDNSAWYHLVMRYDSANSDDTQRFVIWVNGVDSNTLAMDSNTFPDQNRASIINAGNEHRIGRGNNNVGSNYFEGIMSHVHFCDGYAYSASDFGSTDATTGEWKINTSPSVSYGTNGFFILKDGNSVTDQSGNSNNFTVGGGTLTNTEDCPDNNFCTLNPLDRAANNSTNTSEALSNGNTTFDTTSSNSLIIKARGTIGVNSGKYYWEGKYNSGTAWAMGFCFEEFFPNTTADFWDSTSILAVAANGGSGTLYINGRASDSFNTGVSLSGGDIFGFALDIDNKALYVHKNGTYITANSAVGNPTSGSSRTGSVLGELTTGGYQNYIPDNKFLYPFCSDSSSGATADMDMNFGNGYFGTTAISSEGTNASGIGKFEYDVPTGYTALSTKGLNE